jgi:hypothetical protein
MIPDLMAEIERLRTENAALATRPCIACEIITPAQIEALRERCTLLETELQGAILMLDLIDADSVSVRWGTVAQFVRDRQELNETFNRLTRGQK